MNNLKRTTQIIAVAVLLAWLTIPSAGTEKTVFLKGKVYWQDEIGVSLAKKCAAAEKAFTNLKSGDVFFIGYAFESRHRMDIDTDWASSEPFWVTVRNDEIKLDRASQKKRRWRIMAMMNTLFKISLKYRMLS